MLLSNRSYIRSNCKQRPSCAAGVNVRAQHVLHGSCATQHRAFEALQSATPTCIATLIETVPQFKALTAASDLHSGQTVLLLPPCNSLCVPVNGPIYSWERDWLEPFEASHGPLPAALYHYLIGKMTSNSLQQLMLMSIHEPFTRRPVNALWSSTSFITSRGMVGSTKHTGLPLQSKLFLRSCA